MPWLVRQSLMAHPSAALRASAWPVRLARTAYGTPAVPDSLGPRRCGTRTAEPAPSSRPREAGRYRPGRYSSGTARTVAATVDASPPSLVAQRVSRSTMTRFCSSGFPSAPLGQAGPQDATDVLGVIQAHAQLADRPGRVAPGGQLRLQLAAGLGELAQRVVRDAVLPGQLADVDLAERRCRRDRCRRLPGAQGGQRGLRDGLAGLLVWRRLDDDTHEASAGMAGSPVKITVDGSACMRHGRCYQLAPGFLSCDDEGYVTIRDQVIEVSDDEAEVAEKAAGSCPEEAITLLRD
jgi:ferredoxin